MLQESDIKLTAFLSLCQRALFQPIEVPVTMKLQSNYFNIILTKVFDKRSGKERKECSERGKRGSLSFHSQNLVSNSAYYLPHDSYEVSLENLVLDQLVAR